MCMYCKCNDLTPSLTTHVVNYKGNVIVVKNVPCEECEQCREKYICSPIIFKRIFSTIWEDFFIKGQKITSPVKGKVISCLPIFLLQEFHIQKLPHCRQTIPLVLSLHFRPVQVFPLIMCILFQI